MYRSNGGQRCGRNGEEEVEGAMDSDSASSSSTTDATDLSLPGTSPPMDRPVDKRGNYTDSPSSSPSALRNTSRPGNYVPLSYFIDKADGCIVIQDQNYKSLSPQDVRRESKISSGFFSKVYHGSWKFAPCVIKQLLHMSDNDKDLFAREIYVMQQIGAHPHCVAFYGAYLDRRQCFNIVTERAAHGSLEELLHRNQNLPFYVIVGILRDAALGVHHMHTTPTSDGKEAIIHRDIAARNVLVGEGYKGMIADYGLSKAITDATYCTQLSEGICAGGDYKVMAPESLLTRKCCLKSDSYSFGLLIWSVCTGGPVREQWPHLKEREGALGLARFMYQQQQIPPLDIPERCHPRLKCLIERCLQFEPQDRPSVFEIYQVLDGLYNELTPPAGDTFTRQAPRGGSYNN